LRPDDPRATLGLMPAPLDPPRVAVVLPCHNEEIAVGRTIEAFRAALPGATIYVYDNASTDKTAEVARAAGARVCFENRKGKGNVVRRAFADIDADIYVMADGDGTYETEAAPRMVERLKSHGLDMVTGARVHDDERAFRPGHVAGNRMFNSVVSSLFGRGITDLFSGYRVLSRRFVKTFPSMSEGFEIEAEMSIHALQLRMPVDELPCRYAPRMAGSVSKLSTWRDGLKILSYIFRLQRLYGPRRFFGVPGILVILAALGLGTPVVITYFEIGLVPHFPTAVLATGMVLAGALLWLLGVTLDATSQLALEGKRIAYLAQPPPPSGP
jgi:glycosyltransferase involved in cell wall biosynthesis